MKSACVIVHKQDSQNACCQ